MKRILLVLGWYNRALHEGVAAFAAERGWHLNPGKVRSPGFSPDWGWTGDGIIADLRHYGQDSKEMKALEAIGVPIIDVQSRPDVLRYPLVATNIEETVQMAFDYFHHQKGFQSFAYYGGGHSYRGREFVSQVRAKGFDCRVLYKDSGNFAREQERINDWLSSCVKPLAVFCDNDDSSSLLTSIAMLLKFNVPSDLAVLGTDNDRLACTCSPVTLSSIQTGLFDVGYTAAELLDRAMSGDPPALKRHLVSPKEIVERQSTDVLAVKSVKVRRAIELMKRDHSQGLTIRDVVDEVGMSHTGLETAFKREIGVTPVACLRDIRMRESAKLLKQTDEKIQTVGRMVGMPDAKHFSTVFRRTYGVSPREYRKQAAVDRSI